MTAADMRLRRLEDAVHLNMRLSGVGLYAGYTFEPLSYNKQLAISDFYHPDFVAMWRDFDSGGSHPDDYGAAARKLWEMTMVLRAMRDFGAFQRDARVLCVGAGHEPSLFYLTRHAGEVHATDLYESPGAWGDTASDVMLTAPETLAPFPFERDRLTVRHMDALDLDYPDSTFDAVYSTGSIEHFGTHDDIARSVREAARVLKPGGVFATATEGWMTGPPDGVGFGWRLDSAGTFVRYPDELASLIFRPEHIVRCLYEASDLAPVDALTMTDPVTLEPYATDLDWIITTAQATGDHKLVDYPIVANAKDGYFWTSVCIVMQKPLS